METAGAIGLGVMLGGVSALLLALYVRYGLPRRPSMGILEGAGWGTMVVFSAPGLGLLAVAVAAALFPATSSRYVAIVAWLAPVIAADVWAIRAVRRGGF